MAQLCLEDCIAPLSRARFLSDLFGKSVAHFPGQPERFTHLVTLAEINHVLSRLVVSSGMLRLKHGHDVVPISEYLTDPITQDGSRRLVKAGALESQMRAGATLIIDQCQGIFQEISTLCRSLSESLVARAEATLFVALIPEKPMSAHWDSHDVLICQVLGQKRWPVSLPQYHNPLRSSHKGEVVPSPLVWDGVVTPGDALYVPRGWPHRPTCVVAPSVHVTIDINRPTGVDLLRWIVHDLAEDGQMRGDVPVLSSPEAKRSYAKCIRERVARRLSDEAIEEWYRMFQLSVLSRNVDLNI